MQQTWYYSLPQKNNSSIYQSTKPSRQLSPLLQRHSTIPLDGLTEWDFFLSPLFCLPVQFQNKPVNLIIYSYLWQNLEFPACFCISPFLRFEFIEEGGLQTLILIFLLTLSILFRDQHFNGPLFNWKFSCTWLVVLLSVVDFFPRIT